MSLSGLFEILHQTRGYGDLRDALADGRSVNLPLYEPAKPCVLGALWSEMKRPFMVLCALPEDARRLYDQLLSYCGGHAPIYHFASVEVLPYERLVSDWATVHERLATLGTMSSMADLDHPPMVVASVAAVMQKTLDREIFSSSCHTLRVGQSVQIGALFQRWIRIGYTMGHMVESPGNVSRRGGIVDIFPPGATQPSRIELWGDRISSIRLFDPITQRSKETVESVTVIPASEILPEMANRQAVLERIEQLNFGDCAMGTKDRIEAEMALLLSGQPVDEKEFYSGFFNDATVLDYFSDGVMVMNEVAEIKVAAKEMELRAEALRRAKTDRGEIPGNFPPSYRDWGGITHFLDGYVPQCHVSRWGTDDESNGFEFTTPPSYWGRLEAFAQGTRAHVGDGARVVVVSQHAQRLGDVLREHGLGVSVETSLDNVPKSGSVSIINLPVDAGWVMNIDHAPVSLLTDADVFGRVKQRPVRRHRRVRRAVHVAELTPGSYVVHADHGIGRFTGTTTVMQDGSQREYLVVEYAEKDKLYVPTEHLDRVTPYVSAGDQNPSLTRLGSQEWERVKERAKKSVQNIAEELLALYAEREMAKGISFAQDSPWQSQLEDSFPYVETPDQYQAIQDMKADMERASPMDRVVCGDVGYGKTEVALRAAFKSVMDGYQVAMLVPTTVLAQQHYVTVSERLAAFPVRVEVLSRFRSLSEQQDVVRGLKTGSIDIVIGTHRLLQKDIGFTRLGLVIIDEEQRFGVSDKERLKRMRRDVDVLTLTATPIPRTLHMALSGLRDMSTMETPPDERLPINTYVSEYSDDLVREAILRELDRGGQVFFLHNRVHSIRRVAGQVQELVPEAVIGVAHGRMREEDLVSAMADFGAGRSNVLVCTTIIESGLDFPGVNTLIIDRADRLGLAQLYQLRGRIGRSAHRAYAYLLIPAGRRITEVAQKRLQTIMSATTLGAGFRIAMKDLEIRGAGNILGAEQSGQINAVGFELYSRLLYNSVEEAKACRANVSSETREMQPAQAVLELGISAYIPADYIIDIATRLDMYQRLIMIADAGLLHDVTRELRDRFGQLPEEVHNLLYMVRIRVLCKLAHAEAVTREKGNVVIRLTDDIGGAGLALEKALGHPVKVGNRQIRLPIDRQRVDLGQALIEVLERLAAFREQVAALVAGD